MSLDAAPGSRRRLLPGAPSGSRRCLGLSTDCHWWFPQHFLLLPGWRFIVGVQKLLLLGCTCCSGLSCGWCHPDKLDLWVYPSSSSHMWELGTPESSVTSVSSVHPPGDPCQDVSPPDSAPCGPRVACACFAARRGLCPVLVTFDWRVGSPFMGGCDR